MSSTISMSNVPRAIKRVREPIRPLDRQDAVSDAHLVEPQILGRRAIQAIEIDVVQREPAAAILVDQRERRAADLAGIDAQALGQAADERGLACAKIPGQQQHVAGLAGRRPALWRPPRSPPPISSSASRDRMHFTATQSAPSARDSAAR